MRATPSECGVQFHPGFTGRNQCLSSRPEFRVHQGRMPLFLRQNGHGADLPWEAAVGHCPCDSPSPSCERLGISSSSRLQILRLGKVRGAMVSAKVIGIRCLSPYPGQNLSSYPFPCLTDNYCQSPILTSCHMCLHPVEEKKTRSVLKAWKLCLRYENSSPTWR